MLKYRLVQENFKQLEEAKEVLEKTEKTETSQQNTPTPAVSASGAEQLAMIIRQMEMNMSQNYDFSTEKTVEENAGTNSRYRFDILTNIKIRRTAYPKIAITKLV